VLLEYFDEKLLDTCGNCDTCIDPVKCFDATVATQKALSCVYQAEERFGASYIIDVLLGNNTERITNFGHQKISTFGVGKEYSKDQWRSIFRQLVAKRLLLVDIKGYGGYRLGEKYKPIFRGEETVLLREESFSKKTGRSKDKKSKKKLIQRSAIKRMKLFFKPYVPTAWSWRENKKSPHLLFSTTLHYWKWLKQGQQQLQNLVNCREWEKPN
jgi:ATP-dependent DNA helicase RecQ